MSIVTHKYTPSEMSPRELESTFAAREHTVDYLLKSLRDQIHKRTLSSFVITGPRGAGKSTIIHMVALRIRQDAELGAAWIPVVFPEEQFNIGSLRDLLAATLQVLAAGPIPAAKEWLDKVEAEPDEEQSQQLAVTGLRDITRREGKRIILFIENLNHLLEDYLSDQMKGTLRRLLMTDAFMMVIGSAVHSFDALKHYDEAFFNYFGQVPLDRLSAEQVTELLRKRAEFDHNEQFLQDLPQQQAKVRTLVHLTGGNPRFVLMLYELLSLRQVTTIVQYLRKLVDELTPLLKDEMERLPPQQRKIIHALMEKGGTAQPTDLTKSTRLPLNVITVQLKRLKDEQIVEVLGGGKGRAANYTFPDKLFSIWYQMRYLNQNRRRIEMFVEVLRIWFAEEERVKTLRRLAEESHSQAPGVLRECASTAEYFAASLIGTVHEQIATDLCVGSWVKADLKEAASVYADLRKIEIQENEFNEVAKDVELAGWLTEHDDAKQAKAILDRIIEQPEKLDVKTRAKALVWRALAKDNGFDDHRGAFEDATEVTKLAGLAEPVFAVATLCRAVAMSNLGDVHGALTEYSAFLSIANTPASMRADAFRFRGSIKAQLRDHVGAIKDYDNAIKIGVLTGKNQADALIDRGLNKDKVGDYEGAINDYTLAAGMAGAPPDTIARALVNRGLSKKNSKNLESARNDWNAVIKVDGVSKEGIARALICRGKLGMEQKDWQSALTDFQSAIQTDGAPKDQIAMALACSATCHFMLKDIKAAVSDAIKCMDIAISEKLKGEEYLPAIVEASFGITVIFQDLATANDILSKFCKWLDVISKERVQEVAVRLLREMADPKFKAGWLMAWRFFMANLKPEFKEAIGVFQPVGDVLEGKNRVLLDALPPEQRDFALEVLAKFEPEKESNGDGPKRKVGKKLRKDGKY